MNFISYVHMNRQLIVINISKAILAFILFVVKGEMVVALPRDIHVAA